MPVVRYINDVDVQGWEPTFDGGTNAGFATMELPSSFGSPPVTTAENTPLISRRQAPSTRARAAAYSTARDFTFVPRPGPSPLQRTCVSASASALAYNSATQSTVVPTSARNAAAAGRSGARPRSSTERKIARKLAENANYVPRPKNSFILFRTEFVAQRTGAPAAASGRDTKRRKGYDNGSGEDEEEEETNQSLSKQASAIWNKMTEAQKRPWAERAKLEKAEHEARYPHYRYKPVRQGSTRKSASATSKSAPHPRWPSPQRTSTETSTSVAMDTKEEDKTPNAIYGDQFSAMYYSSAASSSSTLDTTLQMSAPMRMLSLPTPSPSSSALANALISPAPTPTPLQAQARTQTQAPSTCPALPTVPPMPALNLSEPASARTTGLPPIPRSPSAPVFDARIVGQFPQQQPHFAAASGLFNAQNGPSHPYPSVFAARPASCPSTPQMPESTIAEVPNVQAMFPLSSRSDLNMQSALPTPEGAEAEYFHDFVQYNDDVPAGPAFEFGFQHMFTNEDSYEMQNDDETRLGMDIDMHALLSLSPVPEVPETAIATTQQPLEAVAALWAHDQQRMNDSAAETGMELEPQPQSQSQTQTTPADSPFISLSPENIPSPEVGLGTYALAVSGDRFLDCAAPGTASTCTDNTDLFRLDMDLELELGCAARLPPSALSFSALGGDAPADDIFGYDRERGLYGFGYELGVGSGSGFDYGF